MTYASLIFCSRFREPGQLGFEQPPDFVVAQAFRAQLLDGRTDDRLSEADLVGEFLAPGAGRHERAGAVPKLENAVVLELAIGLRDGVRVDDEFFGERTDAGKLVARAKGAGFDGVLHLLHELEVDGNAERGIGAEQHHGNCITDIIQYYCDISSRGLSSPAVQSRKIDENRPFSVSKPRFSRNARARLTR